MAGAGEVLIDQDQRARSNLTSLVGMTIFLASWAMMFAGLFFAYGLLRAQAAQWPPPNVPLIPVGLPAVNTVIVGASSALLVLGLRAMRRGRPNLLGPALLGALALGVLFLILQVAVWIDLRDAGLVPSTGQYASVFYGLTWVHAAHVGVGLIGLLWLMVRAFAGTYSPTRHRGVKLWAMYWHFVGIVWLLMFVVVYLL